MTKVSILGLGKLGSPIAAVFADRGCEVIGVDTDPQIVAAYNEGKAPALEPGVPELVDKNKSRISAMNSGEAAVLDTDMTFVVVPTPSQPDGLFSNDYVLRAIEDVGRAIAAKSDFHLVVLSSTVSPGSIEDEILPALEEVSGKSCGVDFGFCYSPEFIALGTVIQDLLQPDFILIGESDPRSGDMLAGFYGKICENRPQIARMNFINAEMTKLAVNTFVTAKISFANMIADLCETLPGADADVITNALGLDSRIGSTYLRGAVSYGGPCFPRDNIAMASFARKHGARAPLAEAADEVNQRRNERLGELVLSRLQEGEVAAILGLSYKPDTGVVEDSVGLALAQMLADKGVKVVVFDPAGMDEARKLLPDDVTFASSLDECSSGAQVLVITTAWDEFRRLRPTHLDLSGRRPVVIDCWGILPSEEFEQATEYIRLGRYDPSRQTGS